MVYTLPLTSAQSRNGHWALMSGMTAAGVDTGFQLLGALGEISGVSQDLLIDGLSVRFIRVGGAGAILQPFLVSKTPTSVQHSLTRWVTAAIDDQFIWDTHSMPVSTTANDIMLNILVPTVLADVIRVSMWGRFQPSLELQQLPQPVELKKISLWGNGRI